MGFIVGNLPGAVSWRSCASLDKARSSDIDTDYLNDILQAIGAYSGGKIGQIRDAKGKAVATVFMSLSADKKYSVLQSLLAKVMAQVAS